MSAPKLFCTLSLIALLAAPLTAVHTHLVKADPGVDSTVIEMPKQVRLWFNEAPEVALSSATLLKSDTTPVARITLAATDDTLSVAGTIPVTLAPGQYYILWKTGSKDGHAVRGRYQFTYAPAKP